MPAEWLDPNPPEPARIQFVMLHPGYVRNYESTLRVLLDRGHEIQLAFAVAEKQAVDSIGERLSDEYPNLTIATAARPKRGRWRNVLVAADGLADFSRYLHPRYRDADKLRDRVAGKVRRRGKNAGLALFAFRWLYTAALVRLRSAWLSDFLVRFWLRVADHVPSPPEVRKFIEAYRPDLLLSSPLVAVGSYEAMYMRAANRMGIRTGLCVASWDNLSNKGVVKGHPDRTFVWNEIQRREAAEMHYLPIENVRATGAQRFDGWFEQKPAWSREEFCRLAELDPARPYFLYVCSSPFIAADEVSFLERFLTALREQAPPSLRDAGVLIRPHPQNAAQWQYADLSRFGNVSIWPRAGEQPVSGSAKAVFFDSIHHSATVIGINTSAQIEAGIIGRSVHTVLSPEFQGTQEGTLHFHYLLHENGGLLHVAGSLEELLANLAKSLSGELDDEDQLRRFVESFIRPLGRDVPGSPVLAGEIERLALIPAPAPHRTTVGDVAAWLPLRLFSLLGIPVAQDLRNYREKVWRAVMRVFGSSKIQEPAERVAKKTKEAKREEKLRRDALLKQARREEKAKRSGKVKQDRKDEKVGDEKAKKDARARKDRKKDEKAKKARKAGPKSKRIDSLELHRTVKKIAKESDRKIVAGPWFGDARHEIIYWIPFLRRLTQNYSVSPSRLVAISAGGSRSWYRGVADDFIDLGGVMEPEGLAILRDAYASGRISGQAKQLRTELMQGIRRTTGTAAFLSPDELLRYVVSGYREDRGSIADVLKFLDMRGFQAPEAPDILGELPKDYIAVHFETQKWFPDTAESRAIADAALSRLSERSTVVVLGGNGNGGSLSLDMPDENAFPLADVIGAERAASLDAQSACVAAASSVVGTYGALTHVAQACGKGAVGFYSAPEHLPMPDLNIAYRMFMGRPGWILPLDGRRLDWAAVERTIGSV